MKTKLPIQQVLVIAQWLRGPSIFFLSAVPRAGKTVIDLEQALRSEIEKIIKDGTSLRKNWLELKHRSLPVMYINVIQSILKPCRLDVWKALDCPIRDIDTILEKLKAVTAEQIREVAKKYFNDDSLTVAVLDPQPLEPKRAAKAPSGLRH